jgi:hypothetical protein
MIKITFLFLFSIIFCAQSFHGVHVGQSLSATQQAFLNKGFTHLRAVSGIKYMKGVVNGDKHEIGLVYTPTSKKVWKIVVYTSPVSSWSLLKYQYGKFKDLLTKKYGAPTSEYWFFKSPYSEMDGLEMLALSEDALVSSVFYEDAQGNSIHLEMVSYIVNEGQIKIGYQNAEAAKIYETETEKLEQDTF